MTGSAMIHINIQERTKNIVNKLAQWNEARHSAPSLFTKSDVYFRLQISCELL